MAIIEVEEEEEDDTDARSSQSGHSNDDNDNAGIYFEPPRTKTRQQPPGASASAAARRRQPPLTHNDSLSSLLAADSTSQTQAQRCAIPCVTHSALCSRKADLRTRLGTPWQKRHRPPAGPRNGPADLAGRAVVHTDAARRCTGQRCRMSSARTRPWQCNATSTRADTPIPPRHTHAAPWTCNRTRARWTAWRSSSSSFNSCQKLP